MSLMLTELDDRMVDSSHQGQSRAKSPYPHPRYLLGQARYLDGKYGERKAADYYRSPLDRNRYLRHPYDDWEEMLSC